MKLRRPMSSSVTPSWDGAKWVGEIDYETLQNPSIDATTQTIFLEDAEQYATASLLVRRWGTVMGFIEAPIFNSFVMRSDVEQAVKQLPVPNRPQMLQQYPRFTVVICTHNRADMLAEALASVMHLDYPNFEVLVVENAPLNTATKDLLDAKFPGARYAVQPIKGLAHARNMALKLATTTYIAFTDDDVVVDPLWLQALAGAFAEDENIACVSGLVPSGEFISATQAYFDQRVTWSHILDKAYYSLAQPPKDVPAFPFAVGRYGTGANFAIRTDLLPKMKFDTAFGAGTLTGGGEDIDFFTRVIFANRILAVEPAAVVWHRHRADEAALAVQAKAYGIGLGAWLTKLALNPRMWLPLLSKVTAGRRQLDNLGELETPATSDQVTAEPLIDPALEAEIRQLEKQAVIWGPVRYFQQKRRNRIQARRDKRQSRKDKRTNARAAKQQARQARRDAKSQQRQDETRAREDAAWRLRTAKQAAAAERTERVAQKRQARRDKADARKLARTRRFDKFKWVYRTYPLLWVGALIALAQGVLLLPVVPEAIRGIVLGAFIFTQPGMLLFYRHTFNRRLRAILVLGLSLACWLILTTFAAMAQVWQPQMTMLISAGVVFLAHVVLTLREVRRQV